MTGLVQAAAVAGVAVARVAPPTARSAPVVPGSAFGADAALTTAGVAAAGGCVWAVADQLSWAVPALTWAGIGAAAVAAGLVRASVDARAQLREVITLTLEGTLAGYCRVVAYGGSPRRPRSVHVTYAPTPADADPGFAAAVASAVSNRVQGSYRVRKHQRHRCRILLSLVRDHDPVPDQEAPWALARAERTCRELLGQSTAVTNPVWAERELTGFTVRHEAGTRVATSAQRARVERVVSTMLPGRWRARWQLEADTIRFEVRPAMPDRIEHPTGPVVHRNLLPYGVDEDGAVVVWALRGSTPHMVIVGATGAGKTVDINGLVIEIARRGWPVWIVDPKRIEFMGMRDWPNVQIVATSLTEQIAVLHRAHEVMEYRYALIEAGEADESDFEPLFVVLDEYRDFYGAVRAWYPSVKGAGATRGAAAPPVFEVVASLARKGRSASVHLILGTQRPDADFLSGEMRDNFRARISLGRLSPQGAMMMWDAAHIGVATPKIPGRATAMGADDRPVEVQTFWTPDPRRTTPGSDDAVLLERLRADCTAKHPPLAVLPPRSGELYADWAAADLVPLSQHPELAAASAAAHATTRRVSAVVAALGGRTLPIAADVDDPDTERDHTPRAAGTVAVQDLEQDMVNDPEDDDGFGAEVDAEFAAAEDVPVDQVAPGDLVLVDEDTGYWAVIETVEPDIAGDDVDEQLVAVNWRDPRTGQDGMVSLSGGQVVTRRPPLPDATVLTLAR